MEENQLNMQNQHNTQSTSAQQKKRGRWWLFAVLAVCAAPMTASYIYQLRQ